MGNLDDAIREMEERHRQPPGCSCCMPPSRNYDGCTYCVTYDGTFPCNAHRALRALKYIARYGPEEFTSGPVCSTAARILRGEE